MNERGLTRTEITEAIQVFGYSINYWRVVVVEGARWPNALARIVGFLRREEPVLNQAIALGYYIFFPYEIQTSSAQGSAIRNLAWLMHELTHVWQFEHIGYRTLFRSIRAHARYGRRAYDYGGEAELRALVESGGGLGQLNPEQQGEIARHYYVRLKSQSDTTAWKPFILAFWNAVYR